MIASRGILKSYRYVRHPVFNAKIRRKQAMAYVRPVSQDQQERMNQERALLFLPAAEDEPLTNADHANMDATIERMKDP